MPDFGEYERRVLGYFAKGTEVLFENSKMVVKESGKPTCSQGEPKTDIYVLLEDNDQTVEVKISYKKENADFLENKTNALRAEQLFGSDWRNIIKKSTTSIQDRFSNRMLIYKERLSRTAKGAITLGWKFELLNKPGGELSGKMDLDYQQIYDVYAGTNLSEDKRNAYVNGRIIENSGVANYILISNNASSAQDVIDQMVSIDEYIKSNPDIYFACKALNYRTFESKYDGNRPLAVQVDWNIDNEKLSSSLIFDRPLELNGDEMASRLLRCLKYLKISTTDDIDDDNSNMNNINE